MSLQNIEFSALCLLVPFDQEAGALLQDYHCRWADPAAAPLIMAAGGGKSCPGIFNLQCALTEWLPAHTHAQALTGTCVIYMIQGCKFR